MMKAPRHTTHVRLDTGTHRMALLAVKDMDCMAGSPGKVTFLRLLKGKDNYKELGSFAFDGKWPIVDKNED
jgi:CelD/BcsL family acetyltransferase involved in cellulose biosynthesis